MKNVGIFGMGLSITTVLKRIGSHMGSENSSIQDLGQYKVIRAKQTFLNGDKKLLYILIGIALVIVSCTLFATSPSSNLVVLNVLGALASLALGVYYLAKVILLPDYYKRELDRYGKFVSAKVHSYNQGDLVTRSGMNESIVCNFVVMEAYPYVVKYEVNKKDAWPLGTNLELKIYKTYVDVVQSA